jgi:hypothetical protein
MSELAVRVARVVLAVLGLAAVGTGLWRAVQGGFDPVNYVSYFTIQTTTIAAVVLILAALKRPDERPHWLDWWRGAAAVYLTVTFVVVIVLLEQRFGWDDWTDFVTHKLLPIAVVADFLLVDPPRNRLSARDGLWFTSYGIVWLAYTFVHGATTGWYPYPFLDPGVRGVAMAATTSAVIVLAGMALGLLYVRLAAFAAARRRSSRC